MSELEFGIILPQVGADFAAADAMAKRAEEAGFDSVWVADHVLGFPPARGILEAWTVVTAIAARTERIGVGAQVFCQSFRNPALLAKMATTLDNLSGGRLRFLLGAGWHEPEYEAFGWEFPPAGERVEETEDAVRIIRGMFDAGDEPFTYEGAQYEVRGAVNVPAPDRRIPIGVGCVGDRMLDLTARLADEWNFPSAALERYGERRAHFDERCAAHGREVKRSTQIVFSPGDGDPHPGLAMFRPDLGIHGSRDRMVERTGELVDEGLTGFYGFVAGRAQLDALAEVLDDLRGVA